MKSKEELVGEHYKNRKGMANTDARWDENECDTVTVSLQLQIGGKRREQAEDGSGGWTWMQSCGY